MELILLDSFEEVKSELKDGLAKMMDFVVPVQEAEQEISYVAKSIRNAGKVLLMYGIPGVGKSTFIQSLKWRTHMPIREVINLNVSELSAGLSRLPQLMEKIKNTVNEQNITPNESGVVTIIFDYLESMENETPEDKKTFFRDLNGFLRQNPILIIWPITERQDIEDIINYSKAVSGTLFYRGREVLDFKGPDKEKFPSIVKNTISVLNTGYTYSDFQLTEADFTEILEEYNTKNEEFTLRDYIIDVKDRWGKKTERLSTIRRSIPKPTEVWFVFSMPEAEQIIAQFVRKSKNIDECWDAYHAKLDEYIHNNQKAAYWNSNRLQLAVSGAFKTKIMFLQTNALVSCLAAYGEEFGVNKKIDWSVVQIQDEWKNKSTAKKFLESTPIVRQLNNQMVTLGASRGRGAQAIAKSIKAFDEINKIASGYNLQRDGSDKPFNKTIAKGLEEVVKNHKIMPEERHPWLLNIQPDILIEAEDKLICLEFCYTKKTVPSAVADYVLKKMDNYMRQIEGKYPGLF